MATVIAPSRPVQLLVKATIAALSVAALSGIAVLLGGDLDDTGWRVLATSAAFGIACTLAAAGADLLRRPMPRVRPLALASIALAGLAWTLLAVLIWGITSREGFEYTTWTAAILAVESGHASFVLARRRPHDTAAVRALVAGGLAATAAATALALAMVWDLVGEEGEAVQVLGALLIVQLFAAVVPSLLRRLRRTRGNERWIDELDAIAGRLERAATPALARQEAQRLRELARAARA